MHLYFEDQVLWKKNLIIIILLISFHLISFYPKTLGPYTLYYYYCFINSFIPSFYPNSPSQFTLCSFMMSFTQSYYWCFLFQYSGSIYSSTDSRNGTKSKTNSFQLDSSPHPLHSKGKLENINNNNIEDASSKNFEINFYDQQVCFLDWLLPF